MRNKYLANVITTALAIPLFAQGQALEEVIVTAQKRTESIQSVPISISVASGEALNKVGVGDIKSLEQMVPGLHVGNDGPYSNPTVRGVGSTLSGVGTSANVATYVDGFYRPNALTTNLEFSDVESVQVLKGPQGTLFGRNATGGAILVTSKAPTQDLSGSLKVSYGRFNELGIAGYASAGITDKLAGSISLFHRSGDGHIENVITGRDDGEFENFGARVKLQATPTDSATITLAVDYQDTDDSWTNSSGVYKGWATGALLGGIAPQEPHKVSNDGDTTVKSTMFGTSLTAEFEFDNVALTSYTQYRDERTNFGLDLDGTNLPLFHGDVEQNVEYYSQELNLAGLGNGPLDWVLGLYYFHDDGDIPFLHATSPEALELIFRGTAKTDAYAAFGDWTYNFAESWYATLGLRYSREKQRATYEPGSFGGGPFFPPSANKKTWTSFTPRLVLRHELSPDTSIYASWSRGFKSGLFNSAAPVDGDVSVDPEEIDAYEVGLKTMGSNWQLETALFYYDYQDLQTSEWTSTASIVKNAAEAEIYGLDLHLAVNLSERLVLDLSAAYTHAEYKTFERSGVYTWNPAAGGIVILSQDVSGKQMLRTPEYSGNASLTYTQPLRSGDELDFILHYAYQSKIYFDAANTIDQDPYGLLNARITWSNAGDDLSVALFGTNLTNEEYYNQILQQTLYIGQTHGKPRAFGIELSKRF